MKPQPPSFDLARELGERRLVICLGPGGVGKTTLSAAIAIGDALGGRAVDVMTVDPAPRLLDALALDASDAAPQAVALDGLGARRGARLRALKLDPKATFDRLIERHAPSPAARDAILADRIYRNLSNAMAGVADYMAMERLLELTRDATTGLIVLDTPPAREALDFLDAPRRMLELLDSRAVALLGARHGAMRGPLAMLDLQAFVRNFGGMYAGFAARAAEAQALIRDPRSFIVLVTTAEAERVEQAREFAAALGALGLALGAVAINRLMPALPDRAALASTAIGPALKRKLARNLDDYTALQAREAGAIAALRAVLPAGVPLIAAPDLGHEPRTIADLAAIARSMHAVEE
jgi:anion-transporting  ArsA/GET3 family ATPase